MGNFRPCENIMNSKIVLEQCGKLMNELHAEWINNELNIRYNKRMQLANKGDIKKRAEVIAECTKKKEYVEGAIEVLRGIADEHKSLA